MDCDGPIYGTAGAFLRWNFTVTVTVISVADRYTRSPMKTYRDLLTWFGLLWQAVYLFHAWHSLPESLPSHFGLNGVADRSAPRSLPWVLFGVCVLLTIFLSVLEKYPQTFNLPSQREGPDRPRQEAIAQDLLGWIRLEIVLLYCFILWSIVNVAQHKIAGLGVWFPLITVGVVALTVGYSLWRMKTPPLSQ